MPDMVNSPPHYRFGDFEAIDVIEDAIERAPDHVSAYAQGQALKYILRMWSKGSAAQDVKKAVWYLNRLQAILEEGDAE